MSVSPQFSLVHSIHDSCGGTPTDYGDRDCSEGGGTEEVVHRRSQESKELLPGINKEEERMTWDDVLVTISSVHTQARGHGGGWL